MQDAEEILASVLETDLKACGSAQALRLETLLALPQARQRQLLSAWMKGQAQYRPAFEMVQRLVDEVIWPKRMHRQRCIGMVFIMCVLRVLFIACQRASIWHSYPDKFGK